MSDLILHHYDLSPFSEKIRLVLGAKRLQWRSVIVPSIMPKPDVVALTGGYRRIPFMQIGADIYCDTALMCQVIDRMAPDPPLYPAATGGLAEIVAQWADSSLFWTAVPYTIQPSTIADVIPDVTQEFFSAFAKDRAAMNPNRRRVTHSDGLAHLHTYLARLENLLADGRRFLLGEAPCIADFSVAQSLWFMRRSSQIAKNLEPYERLSGWFATMQAFGHGTPAGMSSEEAIALAASGGAYAPTTVDSEYGFAAGAKIAVTPADYAHDAVVGQLVGLTRDEVVIERTDARAGRVRVHFPRLGFEIEGR